MPNPKMAKEWLLFAEKSLETAKLLYRENHYTDVIAIDIHQTLEKAFKAVYAYYGIKFHAYMLWKYCINMLRKI